MTAPTPPDAHSGKPDQNAPAAPRRRRRPVRRTLQWAVNLAVLAAAVLVLTPAGDRFGRSLVAVDPLAKADYIVVLGGDLERCAEAANLHRQGWAPKVIISTHQDSLATPVRVLRLYGVPDGDILRDGASTRTATHPATVAALPGVNKDAARFLIVTSVFHTSRSRACFLKAGYRNVQMRAPAWRLDENHRLLSRNWSTRAADLTWEVYETLAWQYYRLRGWV